MSFRLGMNGVKLKSSPAPKSFSLKSDVPSPKGGISQKR